jgi:hypothetical protein
MLVLKCPSKSPQMGRPWAPYIRNTLVLNAIPFASRGSVEAILKVRFLFIELTNCTQDFVLPLQTSPEGAALKSPSGDLGVFNETVTYKVKTTKNLITRRSQQ